MAESPYVPPVVASPLSKSLRQRRFTFQRPVQCPAAASDGPRAGSVPRSRECAREMPPPLSSAAVGPAVRASCRKPKIHQT